MKERHIIRYYYAIVDGIIHCDGCINAPTGRVSDSIIERCIDYENGQSAITHYEPIKIQSNMSLIRLRLETGRTHQIRVHMKHIGHPLLGDFIYYPDFSKIQRQALHAGELIFEHPITKEHLHLTAPLPDDMASLFK